MYGYGGCGWVRVGSLQVGAPEGVHHLLSGVGAASVPLAADDLVLRGQTKLGGEVVFGLGAAGVNLLLGLAVAEEGKDKGFILGQVRFGLGLQFTDKSLSTFEGVHGPDKGKKGIAVGGYSINSGPCVPPPLLVTVTFILFFSQG